MSSDHTKEIMQKLFHNSVEKKSSMERATGEAPVAFRPGSIPRPMSAVSTPEIFQTTKGTDPKEIADRHYDTSRTPDTALASYRKTAAGTKAEHLPMAERLAEIFKQAIEGNRIAHAF